MFAKSSFKKFSSTIIFISNISFISYFKSYNANFNSSETSDISNCSGVKLNTFMYVSKKSLYISIFWLDNDSSASAFIDNDDDNDDNDDDDNDDDSVRTEDI